LRKTGRTCETQTDRYTDIRSFDRDRQPLKCNSIHWLHFMSSSHVPLYFCTDAVIPEQMEYLGAAQGREAVWPGTVEGHWPACGDLSALRLRRLSKNLRPHTFSTFSFEFEEGSPEILKFEVTKIEAAH